MDFLDLHPFVRSTAQDKAIGAIIGAALGDSIGLYTEFLPRTECLRTYPSARFSLVEPTPFREDSHRDKFTPGDWTDDTDQSLLLILSYLHHFAPENGTVLNAQDIALRINSWVTQGMRCLDRPPLGIGQTIGRVVLAPEYLEDPEGLALQVWLKTNRDAAPNGSLMRTHPLGVMCVGRSLEETFQSAADVGRVTHVDPRCVVSCCLATALVRGIIRGEVLCEKDIDELIEKAYNWVDARDELKNPDRQVTGELADDHVELNSRLEYEEYQRHCFAETLSELQLDDSRKMGYVYKCLATAILCLRYAMRQESSGPIPGGSEIFEDLITKLIMDGGDADTNACAAGALLGAWVGYSRLPAHWERGLNNRDWLLQKVQTLISRVGILEPHMQSSSEVDPDTALDGGRGMLKKAELDMREFEFVKMILEKQQSRREAEERARKGSGLGKWFK